MLLQKKKIFVSLILVLSLIAPIFSDCRIIYALSKKPVLNVSSKTLLIGRKDVFKIVNKLA